MPPANAPLKANRSRTKVTTPPARGTHSGSEVMIAIMGPTGAGKSSFIKLLTGSDDVIIGEGLESETSDVRVVRWVTDDGVVNLIDTPGFDDSRDGVTDAGVLEMIAKFLLKEYKDDKRHLTGLIYFHQISDARVTGSVRRNLRMFQGLCGSQALKNVVIATSKWDAVTPALGAQREKELKSKPTFFKPLIDAGAVMLSHDNGIVSALRIMSYIRDLQPVQAVIVDELLSGKTLGETSAADALTQEIQALLQKNEEDRMTLEREMKDAIEAKDTELQRVIEEERKAREQVKLKLEHKQGILNSQITHLTLENQKMQESLKAKDEEARQERQRTEAEFTRIREEDRKAREAERKNQERLLEDREKARREADRKAREAEKVAQDKLLVEREKELQRIRNEGTEHKVDYVTELKEATKAKYKFAFVGTESRGYCVLNEGLRRWNRHCPHELSNALSAEGASDVLRLFGGPDGKYLLRTRSRIYSCGVASGVPRGEIALYAFGKGNTWFARLESGRWISSGVPDSLQQKIHQVGGSNIKTLSFGPDDSWAMTYGNNRWATNGVHSDLKTKLHSVDNVKNIVLSPWDLECWFVEHGEDVWGCCTPESWRDNLTRILST